MFLLVATVVVGTASSNSTGAPANAAKEGCTCHGPASGEANVRLEAPTEYVPGGVYDIRVVLGGPAAIPPPVGQNSGGFALEVSHGSLSGGSDVRAEAVFATHNGPGNNQRAWSLKWTAPETATEVTFYLSANAVNGDGTAQLDRWNKVAPIATARTAGASTPTSQGATTTTSAADADTAALPLLMVVGVLVGVALLRRRA